MLIHRWRNITAVSSYKFQVRRCSWKNFTLEDELTLDIKKSIEKKWAKDVYGIKCPAELSKNNKPIQESSKYILSMFPYPSGKLHLGHVRVYTLSDVISRFYRLRGYNVIHPMGWDAFGLPAENAARENNIEPDKWTRDNIEFMKKQLIEIGCCFDWNKEFATCDPSYYKWTQWLFIKLWEKGLVYKKRAYVYWDPVDQTVLAEEQVDPEMRSWRSGAKVEKKLLSQWFVKTTVFAEDLLAELTSGKLEHGWRDIIDLQKHWIGDVKGKSCETFLCVKDLLTSSSDMSSTAMKEPIRIWFSKLAALENAKYFILNPDHFLARSENAVSKVLPNGVKILKFRLENPLTQESLPVVTGPAEAIPLVPESSDCRTDEKLSEEFEKLSANEEMLSTLSDMLIQESVVVKSKSKSQNPSSVAVFNASLKLRDWLVSRQRRWGTPIPVINCLDCGHASPVPFEMLPISHDIQITDKCISCGSNNQQLDKDTLDTFFDSTWYFLRYLDASNENKIFEPSKLQNSLPVDVYIGGKEHATLHLYYARFMTHFIYSLGLISKKEPFHRLIPIGVVMGESYSTKDTGKYLKQEEIIKENNDVIEKATGKPVVVQWEKMSKSKYNGIDPETVVREFGIDMTRLLSVSEAAPTSPRNWPPNNLTGFSNWQNRLWMLMRQFENEKDFGEILFIDDEEWAKSEAKIWDARNFYLKGINYNYDSTFQISVVVTRLQGLLGSLRGIPSKYYKDSIEFERALGTLLITMYPIVPAFGAQLWQSFRAVASHTEVEYDLYKEVWEQSWPEVDQNYELDLICTVNGEEIIVKVERQYLDGMDEDTAVEYAFEEEEISSRVKKENTQVVSYRVDPGFRATLTLFDPTSEVMTKKKKKQMKKAKKEKKNKADVEVESNA